MANRKKKDKLKSPVLFAFTLEKDLLAQLKALGKTPWGEVPTAEIVRGILKKYVAHNRAKPKSADGVLGSGKV